MRLSAAVKRPIDDNRQAFIVRASWERAGELLERRWRRQTWKRIKKPRRQRPAPALTTIPSTKEDSPDGT
jgi:hypothetical protein